MKLLKNTKYKGSVEKEEKINSLLKSYISLMLHIYTSICSV